jgi:hypothetical protein
MLIRIRIERTQPLAGTAATDDVGPLRFDGWLELLRVTSQLIGTVPAGDDASDPTLERTSPTDPVQRS